MYDSILTAGLLGSMCAGLCAAQPFDVLIRNGIVYDGQGGEPYAGSVAIRGDRIAEIGDLPDAKGRTEIDAKGLAITPGFINMLSWANVSLLIDGRSQSDIRQGVTLEILGEGRSMGPWNEAMKRDVLSRQEEIRYEIAWTTLGEYLEHLTRKGVSPNVASFVGAATLRIHEIGYEDRKPSPQELERMRALVRQAMEEGAMGVSTALIYAPGDYADTAEITALAKEAARYDGLYISHIRGEGEHLLEALDEFLTIVREAGVRGEIYHLKAASGAWDDFDTALKRIEQAQADGLQVTADMYTYNASATGLDAVMPTWVQDGGHKAWVERLKQTEIRRRVAAEMDLPGAPGSTPMEKAKNVLLTGFRNESLRHLTGKTLAEVAQMRGTSAEDTAMDLVVEDDSRVGVVMFSMTEENVRKGLAKPWVSICSDSGSLAPEGVFLQRQPHPRAYGSFARFLAKYVREEKLVPLPEAIRRMTSLPARNLHIDADRGRLAEGYFADVVIFDPETIQDHATFAKPHQYATGVHHVFVNGVQVLKDGDHTGATPGRAVYGPGRKK